MNWNKDTLSALRAIDRKGTTKAVGFFVSYARAAAFRTLVAEGYAKLVGSGKRNSVTLTAKGEETAYRFSSDGTFEAI